MKSIATAILVFTALGVISSRISAQQLPSDWSSWKPYASDADTSRSREASGSDDNVSKIALDTVLARFTSVDPHWESYGSWNPYQYGLNSPVRYTDPNGLDVYVNEDGNFLGSDGEGNKVRVITQGFWNNTLSQAKNWDERGFRAALRQRSDLLTDWSSGINITDETWKLIEAAGGMKVDPSVNNTSGEYVWYKPEGSGLNVNNAGAYPIGPGQQLYRPIDGVNTSTIARGNVYKVPDGFRVFVGTSGEPDIVNMPLEGAIPRYGEVAAPDPTWFNLRDAIRKP